MLADLLVNALGQMLGEVTGESFGSLLDRRAGAWPGGGG